MLQLRIQFRAQAWISFHLSDIDSLFILGRMCNLNEECKPTKGPFQDFLFCVNKKKKAKG